MHPLLRSPKQLLMVGLLWSPICLWVIVLHKHLVNVEWTVSFSLVIPPMIIKLFICLSLWYICRVIKLEWHFLFRFAAIHILSLSIINAVWLLLIMAYSQGLDLVLKTDRWGLLFIESIPVFLGVGVSMYFIWSLGYYLVLANEKIRLNEQEILKQRLFTSQAELKALKTTIHPHFLFNGLNMISPLMRKSPERAQAFVTELSDFLLYSLRYGKKELVTVRDELDHMTNYLAIEGERLGERLRVDLKVDESARQCSILPLTLLPLVENAIKHGIGQSLQGGTLSITIKTGTDYLSVEIENPYEKPAHPAKGEGLGLETLKKRMKVYYGSSGSVTVNKGETTFHVKIRIPLQLEAEERR
jgi:sensor histidine kinase YesM